MFDSGGPGFVSTSPEQHNAVFDSSGPGFVSTSPDQHKAVFDSSGPGFASTSPEQHNEPALPANRPLHSLRPDWSRRHIFQWSLLGLSKFTQETLQPRRGRCFYLLTALCWRAPFLLDFNEI